MDNEQVFDLIRDAFEPLTSDRYVDSKGFDFDNIKVRQLYRILKLPLINFARRQWSITFTEHLLPELVEKVLRRIDPALGRHQYKQQGQEKRRFELVTKTYNVFWKLQTENDTVGGETGELVSCRSLQTEMNLMQTCLGDSKDSKLKQESLEKLVEIIMFSNEKNLSDLIVSFKWFKKLF